MSIKLICIDMDGTLLNSKHEISEKNKAAIRMATEKGVKIAITTGRLFTSARLYANMLGIKAPIISSNGAFIREKDEDRVIYKSVLSQDELLDIYNVIKKYDLLTYFNMPNTIISERPVPSEHSYKIMNSKTKNEEDKVKFIENVDLKEIFKQYDGQILKAICIEEEDKEKLNRAKQELSQLGKFEVVSSWANNFEIMAKGTSKGNAVKHLAEILGIKQEEVMCIGDSENDLSMITYGGVGVAMGNALEILKAEAQFVTDTNEEDGVAKAIEKFVLI